MNTTQSLIAGVLVLLALILLTYFLKQKNIFKKDDSKLFSRIVMKITLPALIFSTLASQSFNDRFLLMSGIMALIEILIMLLAWGIAGLLKMKRDETGALILVSAFGMTSLLGYPLIQEVFPGNGLAMEEAVVTSEFGVGLLLFVLGPLIALHFGQSEEKKTGIGTSLKQFIKSPVFIAIIAGLGFSFIPFSKDNITYISFFRFFNLIGHANTLMVCLTIGLVIEIKLEKSIFLFLLSAIVLKLILKPLLSIGLTNFEIFTDLMREIVLIETALPSAILTVVFAQHYKCNPRLVSMAIVTTLLFSILSISLLYIIFF